MEDAHEPAMHLGMVEHFSLTRVATQLVEMLTSAQSDVDATVAAQVEANPALVRLAPRRCRWCASAIRGGRCPVCVGSGADLRDVDPAAPPDVRELVRLEARALVPAGTEADVDVVLALLDDRGLLPLDFTATDHDGHHRLRTAIGAVCAVAPPGTAEPDLRTSLLVQARWHAAHGAPAIVVDLVRDHLDDVGNPDLAEVLGVTPQQLQEALHHLRTRLTAAPLPVDSGDGPSSPPDVVVRDVGGGQLVVEALGAADLGLGIDDELASLTLDPAAAAWRDGHVAGARQLLYLLDRRANTLRRVTAAALEVQEGFIRYGRSAHRPLTRAQVAGQLGLHPSTVSRVVHGAVVALPGRRVLPLAALFGTAEAARDAVKEMFASADPPRTDSEACARLAAQGINIARRTVAKYRAASQPRRTG